MSSQTNKQAVVVDTNVALVAANAFTTQTENGDSELKMWCINKLSSITKTEIHIVLDRGGEILKEYLRKLPHTQFGASFVKWLCQNLWNKLYVDLVEVHKNRTSYDEFPNDPRLVDFDLSDRKFVAVSVAHHGKPPILEATDGKWWKWSFALKRHGIRVEFGDSDFIKGLCQRKYNCHGECGECDD